MRYVGASPETWIHIMELTEREDAAGLAEVAETLYGELGCAEADINRLHAELREATAHGHTWKQAHAPG
jgi:hypothetical protein